MKVVLGQINTTPGDISGNLDKILNVISSYRKADLIVFPELAIPGYLVQDLIYKTNFVDDNIKALYQIVNTNKPKNQTIIVGYIGKNSTGIGKPFKNSLASIRNDVIQTIYSKQLLPFYDVFDEGRYFESGNEISIINISGEKYGLAICEDIWNDKDIDNYNYRKNPLEKYRKNGINNIIAINSSPYTKGKVKQRYSMLQKSFIEGSCIYVNQVGGQDELTFDGHSCYVKNGQIVHSINSYDISSDISSDIEDSYMFDTGYIYNSYMNIIKNSNNEKEIYDILTLGLKDYIIKNNFTSIVFGSSGGIDSAVVAKIACDAIGSKNVYGIRMPSVYNDQDSIDDAKKLHDNLKCNDILMPIEHNNLLSYFKEHLKSDNNYNTVADENIQARIRGMAVMHYANAFGHLPLTTGNKSELSVGYCTLYGDMCGGQAVINDLYKTEVYEIAKYINREIEIIPKNIIDKAPSAQLKDNQKDEDSLLPYPILDIILKEYIENYINDFEEIKDIYKDKIEFNYFNSWINSNNSIHEYNRIIKLVDKNEFKRRQSPIGRKISKVAFGIGRRLPITKK